MQVLEVKLYGRTVRDFGKEHVEVLALPSVKEQDLLPIQLELNATDCSLSLFSAKTNVVAIV